MSSTELTHEDIERMRKRSRVICTLLTIGPAVYFALGGTVSMGRGRLSAAAEGARATFGREDAPLAWWATVFVIALLLGAMWVARGVILRELGKQVDEQAATR
jgi:phosphate/sulfate permease